MAVLQLLFAFVLVSSKSCIESAVNCTWPWVPLIPASECSGSCSIQDCCALTCDGWLSSGNNSYQCQPPAVPHPGRICSSGVCNVTDCCSPHKTCNEEASMFSPICTDFGLVFAFERPDFNEPCSGICTEARCCRAATCTETELSTSQCQHAGLFVIPNKTCSGTQCQDHQTCCREPQSCTELVYANNSFCGVGFKYKPPWSGDWFSERCPNGVCAREYCCDPTTTCGEAEDSIQLNSFSQNITSVQSIASQCRNRSLVFSISSPCTYPSNCTATQCCAPPMTCYEYAMVDGKCPPNYALDWSLDYYAGGANASTCCHQPKYCYQVSSDVCREYGLIMDFSTQYNYCPDGCQASDCCRPPQFCYEASGITCGIFETMNWSKDCTGDCSAATCCEPLHSCWNVSDLAGVCRNASLAPNYGSSCSSNCNISTCCKESGCSEYLQDNNLYCNEQNNSYPQPHRSCNSTTCSLNVCCGPPPPTTSQPTPSPSPTTLHTPSSSSNNCPYDALRALLGACKESDFQVPHTNCSAKCKAAGMGLVSAFAPANVSSVTVCLDEVLASGKNFSTVLLKNLSTVDRAYVIKQVEAKAALCGVPTINGSPIVSYSQFVVGLFLIAIY